MRTFSRLIRFSLVAAAPVALHAQAARFEGVVTIAAGGMGGQQAELQYSVKGNQMRMDISAGGMPMYVLLSPSESKAVVVIPAQRMYMEQPIGAMAAGAAEKKPTLKWTGKKETVAGHECEHVTVTDDGGQSVDVCMAKDMGTFTMPGGPGGRASSWQSQMGADLFPLKVEANGKVELEVVKIEKRSLDASLFALPEGFQKMTVPAMGRPPLN